MLSRKNPNEPCIFCKTSVEVFSVKIDFSREYLAQRAVWNFCARFSHVISGGTLRHVAQKRWMIRCFLRLLQIQCCLSLVKTVPTVGMQRAQDFKKQKFTIYGRIHLDAIRDEIPKLAPRFLSCPSLWSGENPGTQVGHHCLHIGSLA